MHFRLKIKWQLGLLGVQGIEACDTCHVGRRNNTIYLLWEMKSIVMQTYFIVLSSNMAYVAGVRLSLYYYFFALKPAVLGRKVLFCSNGRNDNLLFMFLSVIFYFYRFGTQATNKSKRTQDTIQCLNTTQPTVR